MIRAQSLSSLKVCCAVISDSQSCHPMKDMITFFSLWLASIHITATELPSMKYKTLLTKNYSKKWLHHVVQRQSSTNPYCNLCCLNITQDEVLKDCGFHTMCLYNESETGSRCRGFMPIKYTEAEKYTILDAHNTLRNKVASGQEPRGTQGPQPSAANMRKLEWDNELANIADRWVRQCSQTHDRCRDVERFPVGQNIASDFASKSSHLEFIQSWYDSVEQFDAQDVRRYSTDLPVSTQQYSQIVWSETYRLGCARAVYQIVRCAEVTFQEILVCNYGPAGNIPGQHIYKKGTPCSACYEDTRCESDYPALCARIGNVPDGNFEENRTYSKPLEIETKLNYNGKTSNFNFFKEFLLMCFTLLFSPI